jgi:Na+-transporting methylmalonyl-CoA/oxaloacetate decarboxylase gamma subunit
MFVFNTTLAQVSAAAPTVAPTTSSVVVVGFLFVLIVLGLLAVVTSTIGAFFIKQAARDAAKAAKAAEAAAANMSAKPEPDTSAPVAVSSEEEDLAILAVVAAAVHTVIGDRAHRVVSVRSVGPGWAQEGRRQIFSSHRVR